LIVGLTGRELINKHKRTRSFESEDYDLLTTALSSFDQIIVTPHILTETSNLIAQAAEPIVSALRNTLIELLETQKEEYEPSVEVSKHLLFPRLGLTDCAILRLTRNEVPLITTDHDLYLMAAKDNNSAINFNHLRQGRLLGV